MVSPSDLATARATDAALIVGVPVAVAVGDRVRVALGVGPLCVRVGTELGCPGAGPCVRMYLYLCPDQCGTAVVISSLHS